MVSLDAHPHTISAWKRGAIYQTQRRRGREEHFHMLILNREYLHILPRYKSGCIQWRLALNYDCKPVEWLWRQNKVISFRNFLHFPLSIYFVAFFIVLFSKGMAFVFIIILAGERNGIMRYHFENGIWRVMYAMRVLISLWFWLFTIVFFFLFFFIIWIYSFNVQQCCCCCLPCHILPFISLNNWNIFTSW